MVTREVGADFVQRRIGRNTGEMSCYKGKEKKMYVQNIHNHSKTTMRRG